MFLQVALFAWLLAGVRPDAPRLELGEYSPALTRRLTPLSVPEGTYRIHVSDAPMEVRLEALRAADPVHSPGQWVVARSDVLGVLGHEAGINDRARLARLFGGGRVRVARGSIEEGNRLVAYTVVSPYPDATLNHISEGTMVIVFEVGAALNR